MLKFLLTLSIVSASSQAQAAFGNYNSILFGEQAAGMGGAYTALSEDAAAVAFYNPAALGDLDRASISAAITVFKKYDTLFGKTDDIFTAGLRSNQGFFQSIPSSSSSITRFRKFNFALTFLSPDHSTYSGEVFTDKETTSLLNQQDESLWVGGSVGAAVSTTEFLGISLFYTARNFRRTITDRSIYTGNEVRVFQSDKELTANSIVAILGYQKLLNEVWRMGVSIQLPSLPVGGLGSYHASIIDTRSTEQNSISYLNIKAKSPIPPNIKLGLGWRYSSDLLLSMDLTAHGSASFKDLNQDKAADLVKYRSINNMAVGADWAVRSWLSLRGGVFTNFSSHPTPDESKPFRQPSSINQYGFSFNASLVENENIHYTFGGYYTGGVGTSLQNIGQDLRNIKTNEQIFTMLVGTSYYF